ncbi:prolyl oligopeptidase family serine peptidase [bacterium]|nr:prolyl oligopeptidase family serine peptidase [bacterium]
MSYLQAIILGILQGFTEFLPVSSSGHLVLAQHILGIDESMLTFDIFVHFGTLLAVLVVLRTSIMKLSYSFLADMRSFLVDRMPVPVIYRTSSGLSTITALCIGTVPAVFAGFLLKDSIEAFFSSPLPVLVALFITGIVLTGTFFIKENSRHIDPLRGLLVGIAQAVAIIPGISRSGMTISSALFMKVRRSEAGEFSFLLAIPVITGATVLAVKDVSEAGFMSLAWGPVIIGTLAAFLSGWVSLVMLLSIIKRGSLGYFGFYCIAAALAGLVFFGVKGEIHSQTIQEGGRPMEVQITTIPSSYDGAIQHIRFLKASGDKRPLLVALHTWSYGYMQDSGDEYFKRCHERDWNCIFPDFRGPNNNPLAGGSEAALKDILDAVSWAFEHMSVDHRHIFLAGASGGGHMALLSAGNSPSTWTAVSAWVPISDLSQWHRETEERGLAYAADIEHICDGTPGSSKNVDREYQKRSPLTNLWRAHIIPMDINAGIHDGHAGETGGEGSVPVGHSIRAYNELVKASGKTADIIPEDVIYSIEHEQQIPDGFERRTIEDPAYGRRIHLRRVSGLSRLTLFEGGHEILYEAVFDWFESF